MRQGLLGEHERLHGQPAEGLVGRRGHGGERLLLRLPAPAHRRPQHLRHRARADRRQRARATSCSARTRRSARPTAGCSGSAWRTWTGWWCATSRMIESATFWQDGPEIETGEMRTEDIGTEVFFLPAAAHTEKDGTFTNTQRLLQWHHKAVEPAGDARSDLWFIYHLGRADPGEAGRLGRRDGPAGSGPDLGLPDRRGRWTSRAPRRCWPRSTAADARRQAAVVLHPAEATTAPPRAAAGSTAACYADGVNQAARRKPGREQSWVAPEWGWAWPANRRILYNRASADPDGRPWSERKALRLVGRGRRASGPATTSPDFIADRAAVLPAARRTRPAWPRSRGDRPVHHAGRRQGLAVRAGRPGRRPAAGALRAAGVAVRATRSTASSATRSAQIIRHRENPLPPARRRAGRGRVPVRRSPPTG